MRHLFHQSKSSGKRYGIGKALRLPVIARVRKGHAACLRNQYIAHSAFQRVHRLFLAFLVLLICVHNRQNIRRTVNGKNIPRQLLAQG